MTKAYKVLLVAPAWVGDMVMSQTLLKLLRQRHGATCQIHVLVNAWARDVVKRMPEVSKVIINPLLHGQLGVWQRLKLGWRLRREGYNQAVVLPNSFKSALIPFFAGIPKRTGMLGEMRYGLLNDYYRLDKQILPRMIDRFCSLADHGKKPQHIPYPELRVDVAQQAKVLANLGLILDKPVICLCPAAEFGPAKRWPVRHFADLASQLQRKNYQVWIMGAAQDQLIGAEIVDQAGLKLDLHNLCGRTKLVEVIDLLACAQVVVSNDSGLMHVACAVGVPVLAIYGSTSAQFTPPLSPSAMVYRIDLDCSPCFQRTCRFGHYKCLHDIQPDTILQQICGVRAR